MAEGKEAIEDALAIPMKRKVPLPSIETHGDGVEGREDARLPQHPPVAQKIRHFIEKQPEKLEGVHVSEITRAVEGDAHLIEYAEVEMTFPILMC